MQRLGGLPNSVEGGGANNTLGLSRGNYKSTESVAVKK